VGKSSREAEAAASVVALKDGIFTENINATQSIPSEDIAGIEQQQNAYTTGTTTSFHASHQKGTTTASCVPASSSLLHDAAMCTDYALMRKYLVGVSQYSPARAHDYANIAFYVG
jgi:hypothetical protein